MLINIQNPQSKKTFGSFCLLLILSFFLTQCGKSSKQSHNATQTPDGEFALTLPSELRKHQSGKNITAQLIVDGGTPINMTVDLDSDQVTASTGPLSSGPHSFVIQYFLDGALITTASSEATIIAGQNINIIFTPDLNINVAPTVLATQPTKNATDIATNSSVSATFSQPMDATSLTSLTFTLNGLTGNISGTRSYSENPPSFEARFTPTKNLALAATYTANLTTGISGILGEPLPSAQSWAFTTVDGNWGNAAGVDFDSATDPVNNTSSVQIALDTNGNAISVWVQSNVGAPGPNNIWANRYLQDIGWGTPVLIETSDAGHAALPQISVDKSGNAIAVWQQNDGTRNNIWANRFDLNLGSSGDWEGAKLLETGSGDALNPQVAIDSNGNAIVVWSQVEGASTNILSNRFILGSDWGSPTPVDSASESAQFPQIVMDSNGNALAVWVQADSAIPSIFANRFDNNTTSWGSAGLIESDNTGNASAPQIAIEASGRAIALWLQDDGSTINVRSNRFVPGSGWTLPAQTIDIETNQAFTPDIALDPQGNAFALWRQSNGSGLHIFSNRFDIDTGLWGTPTPLETETISNVGFPQVTFDANGNAIAVWAQLSTGDSFDNAWSSRYTPSAGWQTASKLETEDQGSAGFPQIDSNSTGNAIAIWLQDDGTTTNVQSNLFQ